MKQFIPITLACSLLLPAAYPLSVSAAPSKTIQSSHFYETAPIELSFEGTPFDLPKKPLYDRDTLLLPIKSFLDVFEVKGTWNNQTKTFTVTDGEVITKFQVGNKTMNIADEKIEMEVAPVVINGTLYVEAEAVITSIYCTANWLGKNQLDIQNYVEPTEDSQNSEYIPSDPFDPDVNYTIENI
ncbi:copper amine oxidase N-terminal domain-containing protein [Aneurinibacillus aneurinilyticus]|uniref:copper amine oxidase N-terminal domain-containing protein n=1 Tax=Aneurinibacillus aneurinilyticus TaxID=1391 RepID=UPI0023F448F9|nr:copper amine oxidase N-terminal domain-containing protein [Aneurinibacillus aneurinilyticus]